MKFLSNQAYDGQGFNPWGLDSIESMRFRDFLVLTFGGDPDDRPRLQLTAVTKGDCGPGTKSHFHDM